jgi:DNA primase
MATARVPPQNIQRGAVAPSRDALCRDWQAVGKRALKHVAKRPLTLLRHVNGVTFFHEATDSSTRPLTCCPAAVTA